MTRWTINAPDWLTARPIAHRGLHSKQFGLVENTPAAAAAAVAKNYAIECDIQRTKDGEAVVFHDFTLDRLMRADGRVDAFRADELGQLSYKDCDQRIVSLTDFLVSHRRPHTGHRRDQKPLRRRHAPSGPRLGDRPQLSGAGLPEKLRSGGPCSSAWRGRPVPAGPRRASVLR